MAREAGIAPNSFYRHFRDMDELAVALIDLAGLSLRRVIRSARQRAKPEVSVVRSSVEVFVAQLRSDDRLLHILLREGHVGSPAFQAAVERQLSYFEQELTQDLVRLARLRRTGLVEPALTAKAITRLVFAMGATAMDLDAQHEAAMCEQLVTMVRLIVAGSQALANSPQSVILR